MKLRWAEGYEEGTCVDCTEQISQEGLIRRGPVGRVLIIDFRHWRSRLCRPCAAKLLRELQGELEVTESQGRYSR